MRKWEIINRLIEKHKYQSYLEIGLATGENFLQVRAPFKISVDPDPTPPGEIRPTFKIPSRDFFNLNTETFDIILIDGSHLCADVLVDFAHSLSVLNDGGTIVMHDCNPINEIEAMAERTTGRWNGTVWRAVASIRVVYSDLLFWTVDTDEGVGIARRPNNPQNGGNSLKDMVLEECTEWKYFDENRKKILNLISVNEFVELLDNNFGE